MSLANEKTQNLEFGQCRSSLSGQCGEADSTALQPGLNALVLLEPHLLECPCLSSERKKETDVQTEYTDDRASLQTEWRT